jgi:DNA-binding SARP family transcriptional activator
VSSAPPLRIDLLGGFTVRVDGRSIVRAPSARQQQLVAFLVLHARGGPIPRQRASGTLWPESTEVQAQTNLRRELHHLREGWPKPPGLIAANRMRSAGVNMVGDRRRRGLRKGSGSRA